MIRLGSRASNLCVAAVLVACLATPATAYGQLSGSKMKGDYGLLSGSQGPPGFYLAPLYYRYKGEKLVDTSGNPLLLEDIAPDLPHDLTVNAYSVGIVYVSDVKLLGANVGSMVFPALTDSALELPVLGLTSETSVGLADTYFQPLNLGWHRDRADFITGIGIYAPTGEWSLGGSENRGFGMWSFEFFAGATAFFDEAKNWSFATTGFYETHTRKRDTDIEVGDILTLEGGFGRSFLGGAAVVGLAYYAQWKVTEDHLGNLQTPPGVDLDIGKHRVFGVGPEIMLPVATSTTLIAEIDVRYFWETGARSTVAGQTLLVTATFPVPSLRIR